MARTKRLRRSRLYKELALVRDGGAFRKTCKIPHIVLFFHFSGTLGSRVDILPLPFSVRLDCVRGIYIPVAVTFVVRNLFSPSRFHLGMSVVGESPQEQPHDEDTRAYGIA